MNHKIYQLSDFSACFLDFGSTGIVHSVYRKTINFIINRQLFSIQASGSPLSPISFLTDLSCDEMAELSIAKGDCVILTASSIQIRGEVFSLIDADVVPLSRVCELPDSDLLSLRQNIDLAVSHSHTIGFDTLFRHDADRSSIRESPVLSYALRFMSECSAHLAKKEDENAAAALIRLIGLGPGLTPSGDDFLCGVLAGLTMCGGCLARFAVLLKEQITQNLQNTNDISRAFLECALQNRYSAAVNALLDIPCAEEILASFGQIGHSSGIDTLCGVLYILQFKNTPKRSA